MLDYLKFLKIAIVILVGVLEITFIIQSELCAAMDFSPKERKFLATEDYSSEIEKQIRSGVTSTADLIVDYHPRLWMRGNWDWNKDNLGSFVWRIIHGEPMKKSDPDNDQEKYEFCYVYNKAEDPRVFGIIDYATFGRRYLWTIVAAEARARYEEWNFPADLPSTSRNPDYNPKYTENDLLADARAKLLAYAEEGKDDYSYVGASGILNASVGYDWLVDRKYSDGITPVLSEADRTELQNKIVSVAEYMRDDAQGQGHFFNGNHIAKYCYFIAGLALYEPSGRGISASNNAKAKQYLDEFDKYWIGKILPVLNEQGGSGGWHLGLSSMAGEFHSSGYQDMFVYRIAPFLFAHYTATGKAFETSVFSTGVLKYAIEFQNHMVYPNGEFAVGEDSGNRYQWIAPLFVTSRRRFSSDPEQRWLGELAGYVRNEIAPDAFVDGGSYCMFDQLIWEEKWPNPRSANELGCGTRHFAKLGWVAMRSGFTSPNDLAALFICQRYHWGELEPYAQNSFHIMRKDWLIEGNHNTIYINNKYQREITDFPTVSDGVETYSPGSQWDVGPGIQAFESNDQYDYVFGDATNAYNPQKLEKFTRGFVWIKESNIFVIYDRVVTRDAQTKKSWVVDPAGLPVSMADDLVKIVNGDGSLWIKRLFPAQVTELKTESIYKVTATKNITEQYFVHVLQAVDAELDKDSPTVIADEAELITSDKEIGVSIGTYNVLFKKSGDPELIITGLPVSVDLLNLQASFLNGQVCLIWQASQNATTSGFEIQRSQGDNHFTRIGFLSPDNKINGNIYTFYDSNLKNAQYDYRIKQISKDGSFTFSSTVRIQVDLPQQFQLNQNYPNPFNSGTEISYYLPSDTRIQLEIFDLIGKHLKTIVNTKQSAGMHMTNWDCKDNDGNLQSTGIFFYRLKAGKLSKIKKMVLIK